MEEQKVECRLPMLREDFKCVERAGEGLMIVCRIVAVLAAVTTAVIWPGPQPQLFVLCLILLLFFLEPSLRRLYPDWAGNNDIIGEVLLTASSITCSIGEKKDGVVLNSTMTIKLSSNHIQGRGRSYKDFSHNGAGTLVVSSGGGGLTINFLIRRKAELKDFTEVLKEWYGSGLTVQETICGFSGSGTFLMRTDWPYKELRAAKEKFITPA